MTDSDFEKYYQKGGTYVLPIEVFNELFGEMENWKKECKQKENIIKEVRDFAKLRKEMYERQENVVGQEVIISLLNILDKGE